MFEAALMDFEMDSQDDLVAGRFDGEFDEPTRAALAFRNLTDVSSALLRIQRYEQAALRTYNRALDRLLALQSARKDPKMAKRTCQPTENNAPASPPPPDDGLPAPAGLQPRLPAVEAARPAMPAVSPAEPASAPPPLCVFAENSSSPLRERGAGPG
jgi:hypothetical protein